MDGASTTSVNQHLLPEELRQTVFEYLNAPELAVASAVCRQWNATTESDQFCKIWLQRRGDAAPTGVSSRTWALLACPPPCVGYGADDLAYRQTPEHLRYRADIVLALAKQLMCSGVHFLILQVALGCFENLVPQVGLFSYRRVWYVLVSVTVFQVRALLFRYVGDPEIWIDGVTGGFSEPTRGLSDFLTSYAAPWSPQVLLSSAGTVIINWAPVMISGSWNAAYLSVPFGTFAMGVTLYWAKSRFAPKLGTSKPHWQTLAAIQNWYDTKVSKFYPADVELTPEKVSQMIRWRLLPRRICAMASVFLKAKEEARVNLAGDPEKQDAVVKKIDEAWHNLTPVPDGYLGVRYVV